MGNGLGTERRADRRAGVMDTLGDPHGKGWREIKAFARARLSRIDGYLADNVSCSRLSDINNSVNKETQSNSESPVSHPASSMRPPLAKNARSGAPQTQVMGLS